MTYLFLFWKISLNVQSIFFKFTTKICLLFKFHCKINTEPIYDELGNGPPRSPPPLPPQNPPPSSTFPHYDKPQRSRQPTPFSQTLPGYKSPNSDVPPPVPREYKPAAYGNVPSSSGNDNGAYLVESLFGF